MTQYAWVTLSTNDTYALGALVLAHSLRQVGTIHDIAVLVTSGVSDAMRQKFAETFDLVQPVETLHSQDEENLHLLNRPELGITFTKLHCWRLIKYDKCVFLDADTMVLDNIDELFQREEFSAAPDVGWPDCFNSGVFVYKPSLETFNKLIQFAQEKGSFDGADQGLLNLYFSDWAHGDISKHLPFIYNVCSTACYSYMPAYRQYGTNAKIIHFIGGTKPWLLHFNPETRTVNVPPEMGHLRPILQKWWDIFCNLVHSSLTPDMYGMAAAFADMTLGTPKTKQQEALDDHLHRQCWEVGNIDYMGADSFANIWSKICQTISDREPTPPPGSSTKDSGRRLPDTVGNSEVPVTKPDQAEFAVDASNDNELSVAKTGAETKNAETAELNRKLEDNKVNNATNLIISTTTTAAPSDEQTASITSNTALDASIRDSKIFTSTTGVVSDELIKNAPLVTLSTLTKTITDVSGSSIEADAGAKAQSYKKADSANDKRLKSSHTFEDATKVFKKSDQDVKTNTLACSETPQAVKDTSSEVNLDKSSKSPISIKPTSLKTDSLGTSLQPKPVGKSEKIITAISKEAAATVPKDATPTLVEGAPTPLFKEAIPDVSIEKAQKFSKQTSSDLSKETGSITQALHKKPVSTVSKEKTAISNETTAAGASVAEPLKLDSTKSSTQPVDAPAVPPRKGGGAGSEKRKGGKGKSK